MRTMTIFPHLLAAPPLNDLPSTAAPAMTGQEVPR